MVAAAIAIFLAASVSCVYAKPLENVEDAKGIDYLFTMAAGSGKFADGTLTLEGVPLVVYFADRPQRVSGHMDLQAFLKLWSRGVDNFKDNPPNAELAIYNEGTDTHAVVIISSPLVNGKNISFKVSLLDETIPASFKHSTLFIDPLGEIFPSDQN